MNNYPDIHHFPNDKHLPRKLLRFIVDLTDHCNLNCKGCGHFSPIAKEKIEESLSKEMRERKYGLGNHVRIYNASDYVERLKGVEFCVDTICLPSRFQIYGINSKECIHLCTKI